MIHTNQMTSYFNIEFNRIDSNEKCFFFKLNYVIYLVRRLMKFNRLSSGELNFAAQFID